ncbi:MAG: hypothetical protein R3190_18860 [Thermoanaerobaculia bacterium]|nr:hypothetical protein [Thermoanaerobaculia bacterium]
MLRVFSDKKNGQSKEEPEVTTNEATPPTSEVGDDRIAQGFELLFGSHLKESRSQIDKLEAETTDRLDSLEKASIRHAEALEDLADKSRAALVREDDEYRRRKAVEADLREKIGQVRAAISQTADEIGEKISQLGRTLRDEIETLRGAGPSDQLNSQQRLIEELFEELALVKANFVEREKIAETFAALARDFNAKS